MSFLTKSQDQARVCVLEPLPIHQISISKTNPGRNKNASAPQWAFRALVSGQMTSGKTYTILSLLPYLVFDTLTLYTTEPDQDIYRNCLIPMMEEAQERAGKKLFILGTKAKDVLPLEAYNPAYQNLVIFDDFLLEKPTKEILEYFIRSRHHNVSVIYLTQSFYDTFPMIRKNCQYFFISKGESKRSLTSLKQTLTAGLEEDQLKRFDKAYDLATEGDTETFKPFFLIDKTVSKSDPRRFRRCYDESLTDYVLTGKFPIQLHRTEDENESPSRRRVRHPQRNEVEKAPRTPVRKALTHSSAERDAPGSPRRR